MSIATVAIGYFEKLYTTSHPNRISKVTNTIPTRVIDEMNQSLIQTFTWSEMEAALKQMHPTKALGPLVCLLFFSRNIGMLLEMI